MFQSAYTFIITFVCYSCIKYSYYTHTMCGFYTDYKIIDTYRKISDKNYFSGKNK